MRVFNIHGYKIQLLIKPVIFKNLLFRYFWKQLLRARDVLINYHVCITVCLEIPFSKSSYHIGTSQWICIAIQFTVFYMIWVFTQQTIIDHLIWKFLKQLVFSKVFNFNLLKTNFTYFQRKFFSDTLSHKQLYKPTKRRFPALELTWDCKIWKQS